MGRSGVIFFLKNRHVGILGRSVIVHVLSSLTAIIFVIFCSRSLPVSEYGDIRYAITLLAVFMAFGLPWTDSIILKCAYLKEPVFLFPIYFMRMAGAGIGSIFLYLWISFLAGGEVGWTPALLAVLLLLPFYDIGTGYKNFLIGRGLKKNALNLFFFAKMASFLSIICLISLIYIQYLPKNFLFPGYLICLILPTTFMFFLVARSQRVSFCRHFSFKKFLSHSSLSSFTGLISVFSVSLDKIYLGHNFGTSELALYSILLMFPQELARLTDTFVPLYYDRFFYSKDKVNLQFWVVRLLPIIFLLCLVYGVLFYYLSPTVFGKSYHYTEVSIFLSVVFLCTCVGEYFSFHRVFAQYSLLWYLIFLVFGVIILYLLLTLLAPIYGVMGVLGAVILKQLLMTTVSCVGSLRKNQVQNLIRMMWYSK